MISNLFILCLLIHIAVLTGAQSTREYCQTPDNRNGICGPLTSCNSLYQLISKIVLFPQDRDFLERSRCDNHQYNVCCPDALETFAIQASISTTTATTTLKPASISTTTTTTTPKPFEVEERISVRKCNEYKEFAYENVYTLNMVGPPRVTKILKCSATSLPLIVGGVAANVKEFPHMALIGFKRKTTIEWSCGGTLISKEFVLSAAHCSSHPLLGRARYVRLGEHDISQTNEAISTDFNITKRITHPMYRTQSHDNDIVLFKLNRNVDFSDAIRPACLPEQADVPESAIASGWGNVEWQGRRSSSLLKVKLEIFSQDECNRAYDFGIDADTMVCAGSHTENRDTCQGDSGGPLQIFHDKHICTYTVVGVTSFGKKCGIIGTPGVYTRVYGYLNWIEGIVWPNE